MRRYKWMRVVREVFVFAAFSFGLPALAMSQSAPAGKHTPSKQSSSFNEQVVQNQTFTLVGAGDIAGCRAIEGAQATAKLVDQIPGTVFAAGDLAYEHGNAAEFRDCYGSTWGRFKDRTRPTLGNHEYGVADAG